MGQFRYFMRKLASLVLLFRGYFSWFFFWLSLFILFLFKNPDIASRLYLLFLNIPTDLYRYLLLCFLITLIIIIFMQLLYIFIKWVLAYIKMYYGMVIYCCCAAFCHYHQEELFLNLEALFYYLGLDVHLNNLRIFLPNKLFGYEKPEDIDEFYYWVYVIIIIIFAFLQIIMWACVYKEFKNKP